MSPSRTSSDHDEPRPVAAPAAVREATLADVERLAEVHTLARTAYYTAEGGLDPAHPSLSSPEDHEQRRAAWARVVESPDNVVVAAVLDDLIVGCAAMGPATATHVDSRQVGQLHQIHVVPGRWGRGIGGLLHDTFVDFLARTDRPTGVLETWERNEQAQRFYASRGWRPDGHSRPGPDDSRYLYFQLAARPPSTEHAELRPYRDVTPAHDATGALSPPERRRSDRQLRRMSQERAVSDYEQHVPEDLQ